MPEYYDKNCEPISQEMWQEWRRVRPYYLIREKIIPGSEYETHVFAEWMGQPNGYGPQGALIFKVNVIYKDTIESYDCATLDEVHKLFEQLVETNTDHQAVLPRFMQVADEL